MQYSPATRYSTAWWRLSLLFRHSVDLVLRYIQASNNVIDEFNVYSPGGACSAKWCALTSTRPQMQDSATRSRLTTRLWVRRGQEKRSGRTAFATRGAAAKITATQSQVTSRHRYCRLLQLSSADVVCSCWAHFRFRCYTKHLTICVCASLHEISLKCLMQTEYLARYKLMLNCNAVLVLCCSI